MNECVRKVTDVDERNILVRFQHTYGFMSVVAGYAPTMNILLEEKDRFYYKLDEVIGDALVVLGDLNVENSSERVPYES